MAEQMEILLKTERKPEAVAMLQLLNEMTTTEQQEFLIFIQGVRQGVRFAKGMDRKRTDAAQPV